MKNIAKYLFAISAAALTFAACEKEAEVKPGEPEVEGCYGVYFPVQDAAGSHVYNPTQEKTIDFLVSRTNTKGDIEVPVKAEFSEEGIFTMGKVAFADGQGETTLTLNFPDAVEGVKYEAHFVIDDNQYASKYSSNAIALDFSVMCVEMKDFLNPKTGEIAKITLNEGWWNEVHEAAMRYYEVDGVRTCTIYSTEEGNGIWGDAVDATLEFRWYTKNNNAEGNNFLEVQKQYFGFDYNDWGSKPVGEATYPIYVYDNYWRHIEIGTSGIDDFTWLAFANKYGSPDGGYPVGYYDGNGGLYFTLRYYIPGLGGFSTDPYEFVAIIDGFTRVDYSLDLDTDYSAGGSTPVFIETGVDIDYINYLVVEGTLSAIQVENKVAEVLNHKEFTEFFNDFKVDEEKAIKYATLDLAPEKTGKYTVIVLGYSADFEYRTSASVVINHVASADVEDLTVDIDVFTEDTPARYTSLTEYDSFAFGVAGSDVTEAHIAIFPESTITKNGMDKVCEAVKTSSKYAVDDETLAKINGEGGYYDVASGLDEDTNYYVIVWATNGSLDAFVYDTYKTEKTPEVWNALGKGSYTDDFFTTFFNVEPQTMKVDIEQSADDPTRYRMIYPYDSKYPYNDPGDWDTSKSYDIYFYIADDTHVYIPLQPIGIDWGYGMTWIGSVAGAMVDQGKSFAEIEAAEVGFGVLNDGVITFPTEGSLVVALASYNNGTFYNANLNDAFKIVLPASAEPAAAPAKASKPEGMSINNNAKAVKIAKGSFERDPKAIKVKVAVSYFRKAHEKSLTLVSE